jgi:hypothetical protein
MPVNLHEQTEEVIPSRRMDVRTKLRLLNRVRKVFPEWAIERQAIVIERYGRGVPTPRSGHRRARQKSICALILS